ncbi:MAG: PhoH family protein [Parachlamydiales bacterium]|nr:PhoH family protein [Parachlamydiales bacterium]
MARKTFVIDTNVLIHDPEAMLKFPGNDVILPLALLEELDAMKRFHDELGKNARMVIRTLDALKSLGQGDLHSGVHLENDSTVRIQLELKPANAGNFGFSLNITSNKIILTAFSLKQKGEQRVVLVSKDFAARVKAEACGLEAEDYENQKVSFENIYRGMRWVETSKQDIDQFYKDGHITPKENDFCPNEYCIMTSPEHSSAVGKYNAQTGKISSLLKVNQHIWGINPLNVEQRCAIDLILRDDVKLVTLFGQAGTGKTLLALACGLRKVFDEGIYNRILVSRPIIPLGKDIGYLPGMKEEKLYHWMQPIYDNLEFLCNSTGSEPSETLRWVMDSKKIEMEAVTYIRGRSLPKMFLIIDEAQNLTPHEMKTIISRAGAGTKVVLTGDPTQIDNPYLDKDSNGLTYTVSRFKNHKIFGHIYLEKTERSELAALAAEVL